MTQKIVNLSPFHIFNFKKHLLFYGYITKVHNENIQAFKDCCNCRRRKLEFNTGTK